MYTKRNVIQIETARFCCLCAGIRLRRQRRQLQLGPGHQRGQPLRLRFTATQGQSIGHQQNSNGRRGREFNIILIV